MLPRLLPGAVVFAFLVSFADGAQFPNSQFPDQSPNDLPTLSGEVWYAGGGAAGRIPVVLNNAAGGTIGKVLTDASGSFYFGGLAPEDYIITVDVPGFRPLNYPVNLDAGSIVGLRLSLTPLPVESRSITGVSPLVSVSELEVPENARKEYEKGKSSMAAEKYADAAAHFQKAVSGYPKFTRAYEMLAMANANLGHFSQADRAIHRSLELAPKDPRAYADLGYVNAREGHAVKAKDAFEKSIRLAYNYWFPHLELGRLLLSQKHAAAAYPHLLHAHQLHPQVPAVHILIYDDLLELGHEKDALTELDSFLAYFPKDPQAARARQMRAALAQSIAARSH
jgi:lipoprotein NlpI